MGKWRLKRTHALDYYEGKNVVITGAGAGLGAALVTVFSSAGATVVALDRDELSVDLMAAPSTRDRTKGCVIGVRTDVTCAEDVSAAVEMVSRELGHVDVLVSNAGVLAAGNVAEFTTDNYRTVMEVNFFGAVSVIRSFLPLLTAASPSHLVNISSAFGVMTAPGYSAYSASKFALRALSEALANELRPQGVVVTSVLPGGMKTAIARKAVLASEDERARLVDRFDTRVARNDPAVVARLIATGVAKGRGQILPGGDARLASLLVRVLGHTHVRVVRRFV